RSLPFCRLRADGSFQSQSISSDQKNALRHYTWTARLLLVRAARADRCPTCVEETPCPDHQSASTVGHPARQQPTGTPRARHSSDPHPEFPLVRIQSAQLSEFESNRAARFF